MNILQKQVYECNFNMIGSFLKEAYEKAEGKKKQQILSLIGNINQMYIYTNILETENHILQSREDDVNNEKVKWAERARVAEEVIFKNDTTLRPKEL